MRKMLKNMASQQNLNYAIEELRLHPNIAFDVN